jgi:hypothetical protein
MTDSKRFLGVFIPSKRRSNTTAQTGEEAITTVDPPPFSGERRAEIDDGEPNYDAMPEDELKRQMQLKEIGLRGRHNTEHKINALRAADVKDMTIYQAWRTKSKRTGSRRSTQSNTALSIPKRTQSGKQKLHTAQNIPLDTSHAVHHDWTRKDYYTNPAKRTGHRRRIAQTPIPHAHQRLLRRSHPKDFPRLAPQDQKHRLQTRALPPPRARTLV